MENFLNKLLESNELQKLSNISLNYLNIYLKLKVIVQIILFIIFIFTIIVFLYAFIKTFLEHK